MQRRQNRTADLAPYVSIPLYRLPADACVSRCAAAHVADQSSEASGELAPVSFGPCALCSLRDRAAYILFWLPSPRSPTSPTNRRCSCPRPSAAVHDQWRKSIGGLRRTGGEAPTLITTVPPSPSLPLFPYTHTYNRTVHAHVLPDKDTDSLFDLQVVLCSSPHFSSLLARRSSAENRAARRRASSTDVWSKDEGKDGEGKSSKEEGKYTEESECSSTTSSSVASSSASTTTTSTSGSVSGEGYTMSRAITY